LTNVFGQAYLSLLGQVEDNNVVKTIIEASYKDFGMLDDYFATLDKNELQTHPNSHLFQQVQDLWVRLNFMVNGLEFEDALMRPCDENPTDFQLVIEHGSWDRLPCMRTLSLKCAG
jgi:hypothetical protein